MFDPSVIDAKKFLERLISKVHLATNGHTSDGNKAWTAAVKKALEELAADQNDKLECIYTQAEGVSEFLLDVVWWSRDKGEGATLACECEWRFERRTKANRYVIDVGIDFEKLLVFKAPYKLMIFATDKGGHPREGIIKELQKYLDGYRHHLEGETYLLLDFAPKIAAWSCRVEASGLTRPQLLELALDVKS